MTARPVAARELEAVSVATLDMEDALFQALDRGRVPKQGNHRRKVAAAALASLLGDVLGEGAAHGDTELLLRIVNERLSDHRLIADKGRRT
jgi:hypothetical protein